MRPAMAERVADGDDVERHEVEAHAGEDDLGRHRREARERHEAPVER